MIQASVNGGLPLTLRKDFVIECLLGELIELSPTGIEFVSGPAEPVIDRNRVICSTVGRYYFRLTYDPIDFHVCCVAPEVVEFIRPQVRKTGHGDSEPGPASDLKVRLVIRSLANNAEWFDGSIASLTSGEPHTSLHYYGC